MSASFVAMLLAFSSCATPDDPNSETRNLELGDSVEWFESADPELDARAAADNGDVRLIALALRSLSVPGVDAALKQHYIDKCGFRLVPGIDDVIRNENDLSYLKIAREYALAYNNAIVSKCADAQ